MTSDAADVRMCNSTKQNCDVVDIFIVKKRKEKIMGAALSSYHRQRSAPWETTKTAPMYKRPITDPRNQKTLSRIEKRTKKNKERH